MNEKVTKKRKRTNKIKEQRQNETNEQTKEKKKQLKVICFLNFRHLLIVLVKRLILDTNLVDGLRHTDHLALAVLDGHAEDAAGLVAHLDIDLAVEARVLQHVRHQTAITLRLSLWAGKYLAPACVVVSQLS